MDHTRQHIRREETRIERMPRELPVLPHLAGKGEQPAQLCRTTGGRAGAVFRRQAESEEGAVVGELLKRFGEALKAFAIVHGLRGFEEALPPCRLLRVLDRL